MSKRKSRRKISKSNNGSTVSKPNKNTPQQNRSNQGSLLKKIASLFLAIISIISFLLYFLPQVSIRPEGSLNPRNPFTSPFVITNSGILGINDVTYICRLRHAINDKGGKIVAYEKGVRPTDFKIKRIGSGESSTVGLPFTWIGGNMVSVDFDFVLEYRPDFYPIRKRQSFRFSTAMRDSDGFIWLPRSLSEE